MLLPMADVPRWYAERKPVNTIAVRYGRETLTWDQLERFANRRARALAAKGLKAGDFVAMALPNGNVSLKRHLPHGSWVGARLVRSCSRCAA